MKKQKVKAESKSIVYAIFIDLLFNTQRKNVDMFTTIVTKYMNVNMIIETKLD